MAKNGVLGGGEPGMVKMNFLLCTSDTETGTELEAAYLIPTLLERGASGYFQRKQKRNEKQSPFSSSGSNKRGLPWYLGTGWRWEKRGVRCAMDQLWVFPEPEERDHPWAPLKGLGSCPSLATPLLWNDESFRSRKCAQLEPVTASLSIPRNFLSNWPQAWFQGMRASLFLLFSPEDHWAWTHQRQAQEDRGRAWTELVWAEVPAYTSIKHVMESVGPRVGREGALRRLLSHPFPSPLSAVECQGIWEF